MAELKYIPFYPGYMEDTSDLSDSEFRRLMYALCAFCTGAEQPEPLTGKEVIAYRFITRNIKASQEQYTAKCRKNSENAKKRIQANDSERKQSQANDSQTSQYKEQRTKNKEQNITTTTTAPAREGLQQCVDCYEQNIGAISRAAFDGIAGYLDLVEPALVCEAINQAAINNKRSWGYAQAILRDCLQKNITTQAAYLAEKEARRPKGGAVQQPRRKTAQEQLREIARGGVTNDLPADSGPSWQGGQLLG